MEKIKALIKRHEGLNLKPYLCTSGKLTIGYGRNLTDNGITETEAEDMLSYDIAEAMHDIDAIFGKLSKDFGENRYTALIDMLYNLGFSRFMGFRKMIAAIKDGDWDDAANQAMNSRWSMQVGQRALDVEKLLRKGD